MLHIIADDKIPFLKGVLESCASVEYLPGSQIRREKVKHADALIIRTRTQCNAELLENARVKFIATATIGFDHIDTGWCDANGIRWTNAPGCNAQSVQQYIASVLASLARAGRMDLAGKTIGIIGIGNVGSRVAELCNSLNMNVLLNDPPRARKEEGSKEFCSLEELLALSDLVTVHVPLNISGNDKTLQMADKAFFGKMKKGSWFINSSRGEVVMEDHLITALGQRWLAGAVLDVWENEPLINERTHDAVEIGTPHIAGYSTDGKANGTAHCVRELSIYFNLPFKNWYPDLIPAPSDPIILLKAEVGKTQQWYVEESILHTYNVMSDHMKLRESPLSFEKIRGDYPLRREFSAFEVHLPAGQDGTSATLRTLGFKVV